ncbi:MAG: hypothetical protein EXR67_00045 [Dehalococcoidia bacterium]|nr:hypothetical protein [Dehalococcoidia bacterium]
MVSRPDFSYGKDQKEQVKSPVPKVSPEDREELVNEPDGIQTVAETQGDITVINRDVLPPENPQSDEITTVAHERREAA